MTENEQVEAAWRTAMAMPDVAALIAKDAQENLGGLDVLSVGSVFEPTAKRPVASPWRAPARRYLDLVSWPTSLAAALTGARKLFLSYTVISFVRRHSQPSP
jgi:hypothetical protein